MLRVLHTLKYANTTNNAFGRHDILGAWTASDSDICTNEVERSVRGRFRTVQGVLHKVLGECTANHRSKLIGIVDWPTTHDGNREVSLP